MKKPFSSNYKKSPHIRKKNEDYLDLVSVVSKARHGFVGEQSRLVSKPAKESATQIVRQIDLINNLISMPHLLLIRMEGRLDALMDGFLLAVGKDVSKRKAEERKRFEKQTRETMRVFFSMDSAMQGRLAGPWLFAIAVYTWTAFECLAGDLWANSLNQGTTALAQRVLSSLPSEADGSGLSRRQIEVGLAARYNFDLRRSLGTILRPKFDFTSFDGIASAFEQAFGRCEALQKREGRLKELEQVRHLIVHRGGIVDDKFLKISKLKVRRNTALRLSVGQVRDYIISMTLACVALRHSVDGWFTSQQGKDTPDAPSARLPQ